MKKLYFCILLLTVILSGCFGGGSDTEPEKGKFKVVNSWGKGEWEKVPDGCFYITYEAMKKGKVDIFFTIPKEKQSARLMAILKLEGEDRSGVTVKIGVENTTRVKTYKNKGGNLAFPDNNIAIDISELLPLNNEKIYIEVFGRTRGYLSSFAVEKTDEDGNCLERYNSTITDRQSYSQTSTKAYTAELMLANESENTMSESISRNMTEADIADYMKNKKRYKSMKSNRINGTGLKPISEEHIREMIAKNEIKLVDSKKVIQKFRDSTIENKIDYTESKYFPPIGNQGNKGACVAWSVGYYISTFYTARTNNWDLSPIKTNVFPVITDEYKDKIGSPEFLYHQANDGIDKGSDLEYVMGLAVNIGVCSLKNMGYNETNFSEWPNEKAWREAPKFRSSKEGMLFYLKVEDDTDIEALKKIIAKGYLVSIAINHTIVEKSDNSDVVFSYNYTSDDLDHVVTIAGYDNEVIAE